MACEEEAIADLSGRPLGPRALQKRRRILDATRELVEKRALRELRVADIARAVSTSPASFYQYFTDVEDVVLQLARQANEPLPQLLDLFDGDWCGAGGYDRARRVVEFFMDYWDRHGPILRIRNLAADEGDQRFMELRASAMLPILAAMERVMQQHAPSGAQQALHPPAAALAMSAILDRLAAYHLLMEGDAVTHRQLVDTCATLLHRTLTSP